MHPQKQRRQPKQAIQRTTSASLKQSAKEPLRNRDAQVNKSTQGGRGACGCGSEAMGRVLTTQRERDQISSTWQLLNPLTRDALENKSVPFWLFLKALVSSLSGGGKKNGPSPPRTSLLIETNAQSMANSFACFLFSSVHW